jgi:myo-inositol-1(or 4)-monophosphatase
MEWQAARRTAARPRDPNTMSPRTGQEVAAHLVQAVREVAEREVLPRFRRVPAMAKPDGSVVTEADFEAQRALVAALARIEPLPVMAEEMGGEEQRAAFDAPRFWCVDPLDGTKNFSDGVELFSVSVALMQGARPLLGVVYDPVAGEAFHAVRGAGAWLNGTPLVLPAEGPPLAAALAEVSLRRDTAFLRGPLKRERPYQRRQYCGSATLAWCQLAGARIDVMLHSCQKMWDWAAGALILEEAGGFLCGLEGDDYWAGPAWSRTAVAARTEPLLVEWRDWIRGRLNRSCTPR